MSLMLHAKIDKAAIRAGTHIENMASDELHRTGGEAAFKACALWATTEVVGVVGDTVEVESLRSCMVRYQHRKESRCGKKKRHEHYSGRRYQYRRGAATCRRLALESLSATQTLRSEDSRACDYTIKCDRRVVVIRVLI